MKLIEYRLIIQSNDIIQAFADNKRDSGRLNRESLQDAVSYLEELDEAGLHHKSKLKNLGKNLYRAIFNGDVEGHFRQNALRPTLDNSATLCRISIVFQKDVSPDLISLPWEFLFVPIEQEIFLGTSQKFTLFYKYEDWLKQPLDRPARSDFPLRVLFVHYHPQDLGGISHILVRKDIKKLDIIQAEFDEATNPTVLELHEKLQNYRPHVFHFLTHGRFDHKQGEFALIDSNGATFWYDDKSFGNLFQNWQPGLVVLQACESGKLSEIKAFAGPTGSLMRQQIPAVVSMRYPIQQKHAWEFNAKFYQALADNEPIDAAVQKGRLALAISNDAANHNSHEFGIPTLWMRSENCYVLQPEVAQDATEPASSSASAAEQSWHPPELKAYLEEILSDAEELDRRYIDLSAITTQPAKPLPEKFSWSLALIPPAVRVLNNHTTAVKKQESRLLNSISEALALHPRFVLLGAPGCGKTMTLKKLLSDSAKLAAKDAQAKIPLLFSLSKWPDEISNLPDLIHHALRKNGLAPVHINRLLLLLDGLNEVSADIYISKINLLNEWLRDHQKVSVIISCRQKHYQNNKRLSLPEVQIEPFDEQRIQLFMNAYLGTESAQRLLRQIDPMKNAKRSPRDLIYLADNPYFLFIICYVFATNNECLPGSRGLLFQQFVKILYTREKDLRLTGGLLEEDLHAGLSALAFAMQKRRSATNVHLAWAEKQLPKHIAPSALWELGRGASLIHLAKEDQSVQFTHQLLLEYFAAERLCHRLDKLPEYVIAKPSFSYNQRKGNSWDEVIYTLAGIAEPNVMLQKIAAINPFLAEECFSHLPAEAEISQKTFAVITRRLIDHFESNSLEVRTAAVERLIKIGTVTIFHIIHALQSDSSSQVIKRAALKVLAEFDDFDALHAVLSALDQTGWVRKDAQLLIDNMDADKIEILTNGINSSYHPDSRKIELLAKLYPHKAETVATEEDSNQEQETNDTNDMQSICMQELNEAKIQEMLPEYLYKGQQPPIRASIIKTIRDHRATEVCLIALEDNNVNVKSCAMNRLFKIRVATALNTIREIGNESMAEEYCLPLLKGEHLTVRIAALNALCEFGLINGQIVEECCLPWLKDENPTVRIAALNALCEFGLINGQTAEECCVPLLNDERPIVKAAALNALRELGNENMMEHCLSMLNDASGSVITAALNTIYRIVNYKHLNNCSNFLNHKDVAVRLSAVSIALKLKLPNDLSVENILKQFMDYYIIGQQALVASFHVAVNIRNGKLISTWILSGLRHDKSMIKRAAIAALDELNDPEYITNLQPLLTDKNRNIRKQAGDVIEKLKNINRSS